MTEQQPTPEPDAVPYTITYRSVLPDDEDADRPPFYEVERDEGRNRTLRVGYQYWDTAGRHLVCIRDVIERVRLDNRNQEIDAGSTFVKVESDHPKHIEGQGDGTWVIQLDRFVNRLDERGYVPHDANGYAPRRGP